MGCGEETHARDNCPAKGATCKKYGKLKNYAAVCRSKATSTADVATNEIISNPRVAFLDYLTPVSRGNAWFTSIDLCVQITQFKIDTDAEVTAINIETCQNLENVTLRTPDKKLFGPSKQSLKLAIRVL